MLAVAPKLKPVAGAGALVVEAGVPKLRPPAADWVGAGAPDGAPNEKPPAAPPTAGCDAPKLKPVAGAVLVGADGAPKLKPLDCV